MRVLILNWRDPRNPRAGGAELFTHEVARRLVAAGDTVEWFTAAFPGAAAEEEMDGVRVVRKGRQWTVHWHAFWRYHGRLQGRYDAVIDEVNTVPFFTPLWAAIPTVMLIHQLARKIWWYESRFPVNAIGYAAEPLYLQCYRRVPVLTVSSSTERDLRRLGLAGPITVVPEGLEPLEEIREPKAPAPTFLYVGRLSPSKRIGDIVRAVAHFRKLVGRAQLWLVGDGPSGYIRGLRALIHQLGLADTVLLLGRLKRAEKHQRMAQAHMLLMASVLEGWGLVVIEANALGTPAVVYDVGGLRDAVRHQETGLVVGTSPAALAEGMLRLWNDSALYERLALEARRWSRTFSFDVTASRIREQIIRVLTQ